MALDLVVAMFAVFIGVGVCVAALANGMLVRSPERRRLNQIAGASGLVLQTPALAETPSGFAKRFAAVVPKSPNEMSVLRRRLTSAGYGSLNSVAAFSVAKLLLALVTGVTVFTVTGGSQGMVLGGLGAITGYMLPELWLGRKTRQRQKIIRNGLPDALDLFIVCLEAGSSLDQAIVKASDELDIAYPPLAHELRTITTEVRAGKPRLEAFKNFAARTRVDDVRALVAMLVQTDRFGTSIGQALRTHAENARTKRRQVAEEKAAKLSVKLVFPLVFFLFPALYVVILGPAAIRLAEVFLNPGGLDNLR